MNTLNLQVTREHVIEAVKSMRKKEREAFIEDLLASASPEYLHSIQEARRDYQAGRVKSHKEVFKK